MTTIATLAVKLIADAKAFVTAMDESERKTQNWATNVSKSVKDVGGSITNLGKSATTYLTLPLLAGGLAAVNYASSLEETRNKASVVFGDLSTDVIRWSETAATTLGQSQQQALEAAGTYGNLFLTLGLGQQPAAEMSMELVQLASDLSSFNNANPEELLLALQSGLIGQSEPMRRFGANLTEAAVAAKAMEMGLADSEGELTEAAKVQARYALILEQTTTAQGDFARTADGLANQQRIVKAQFIDAAAALGQQLLPYALQFVQWVSGLIEKFQQLTPEQQKWVLIIAGVVAAIGPLLLIVGSLITAIGAVVGVIGAITAPVLIVIGVILLLVAAAYGLYLAWQNNWLGIQQVVDFVLKYISTVFAAWKAAFSGDWYTFGQLMRQAWDMVWGLIASAVSAAWTKILASLTTLKNNAIQFLKNVDWANVGTNIVQGIANGITSAIDWIVAAVITMGQAVLDAIQGFLGIHSESTVMADLVGKNMALGVIQGWNQYMQPLAFQGAIGDVTGLGFPMGGAAGGATREAGGVRLVNYGTLVIRTDGTDVQEDILRQLQRA